MPVKFFVAFIVLDLVFVVFAVLVVVVDVVVNAAVVVC